jgi:hypothetical protein
MLDLAREWFSENQSPYRLQFYPPFTYVFFAPLLLVDHYPTLYKFFTLFMVISYCFLTLVLPLKMTVKKNIPLIVLFFVTGLTSYGLQFELERGQYNVFTFLLCLWAIYIFHFHPKYRIFAYLLFSLSVQLKLYPAIFIVMLIDNWKDWKSILRRFAGLAVFNILLLFIMGPRSSWISSVQFRVRCLHPDGHGMVTIPLIAVFNLTKDGFRSLDQIPWNAQTNSESLKHPCFYCSLLCFLCYTDLLQTNNPIRTHICYSCMIGALGLGQQHYTLSMLAAPVALVLSSPEPTMFNG